MKIKNYYEENVNNYYEKNQRIVPDLVAATEGEIPIKQYQIAKLRTRILLKWGEARMQVTNKRLIFRATGFSLFGKTTFQNEFDITKVAGIEYSINYRFNYLNFLFATIISVGPIIASYFALLLIAIQSEILGVLLASIVLLASGGLLAYSCKKNPNVRKKIVLKTLISGVLLGSIMFFGVFYDVSLLSFLAYFLGGIIALLLIFLISFPPNLEIKVLTKQANKSIVFSRDKNLNIFAIVPSLLVGANQERGVGFEEVLPTAETCQSLFEIGALVDDIQKNGDSCIMKWQSQDDSTK